MTAEERAIAIADKIVPAYRAVGSRYSCTGTVAKMWNAAYEGAHSAHASQAAQPAEADGWVMVPREPTDDILEAARRIDIGVEEDGDTCAYPDRREARRLWSAMIATTPKAPTSTAGEVERLRADLERLFDQDGLARCDECSAPLFDGDATTTDVDELVALCAGHRDPAEPIYAYRTATPLAPNDDLRAALEWFSGQTRLSLQHYSPMYGDDDDQSVEWRIDRESGPINDREWETIARGETVEAAILSAHAAALKENRRG